MIGSFQSISRRLARLLAHTILFPIIEAFWAQCFRVAGFLWGRDLPQTRPSRSETVLVLAPHPDDETIGCGGTIALHTRAGSRVVICIVTNGARSRGAGLSPEETAKARSIEAATAAQSLGLVELVQLGLPEGVWQPSDLLAKLGPILEDVRPSIIYSTSFVDYHPDHISVAGALAAAAEGGLLKESTRVRLYEVQVPLTPILANVCANIESTQVVKTEALHQYRSQLRSLGWIPRYSRYHEWLYRSRNPLEVFCELTPEQLVAFSRQAAAHSTTYRGIRPRPITDPVTWLVGNGARRRLRSVVHHRIDTP